MIIRDKQARINIYLTFIIASFVLIILAGFVFAAIVVAPSSGGSSFSVLEDVSSFYNITINNTEEGQGLNITQVNITFSTGVSFVVNTNGTNAVNYTFRNSSTTVAWSNFTYYLINGSTNNTFFWFNATITTPGTYNISVWTANNTGATHSNVTVSVNDTTAPSTIAFDSSTATNNSALATYLPINISATDNGVLGRIVVKLFNSSNAEVNSSTSSTGAASHYVTFSVSSSGTYYVNATVNDSFNNMNRSSGTRTYNIMASSFEINGTIYNTDGVAMGSSNMSVQIMYAPGGGTTPTLFPYLSSTSNASGWFNISLPGNSSWMYQISIKHANATTGAIDYVGQSLPHFPYQELSSGISTSYYLKEAGTINITAVNSSNSRIGFNYQLKDTSLGYTIASEWTSQLTEADLYVQRDRNYSVMIYPQSSMPVSFDWSNFSSANSYDFNYSSSYNATTKVVNKQFNATMSLQRYTGYANWSAMTGATGIDDFVVVPYILMPGNMIFMTDQGYGSMPWNMSAWNNGQSDLYDFTSGFYNITLPGPAEAQTLLLLAVIRNGTNYYGSYKNISINYTGGGQNNLTMYGLLGSYVKNITLNNAGDWQAGSSKQVPVKRKLFNLVNASNTLLGQQSEAHIEVEVDYSGFNASIFTFQTEASNGNSNFSLPLLNMTGIKSMNIFSQAYAPRSIDERTVAQINANNNITLNTFNPQALDGTTGSSISMAMYKSNSSCDAPAPASSCTLGSSTNMSNFNPLNALIGGGKISFRMGMGNVLVHYVNVDMLASGPPDALFEDNNDVTETTSGGFGKVMKFGSKGPKIYDYALISMPYTEGSSSTAGLNESATIYMNITTFYDENWNTTWSAGNGTNITNLKGNNSHYNTGRDAEWQTLMSGLSCTTNVTAFNVTNACYVDTTNNRVWVRIPHFSGTGPSVTGSAITVASSSSTSTSTSSGGGGADSYWIVTYIVPDSQFKSAEGYTKSMASKERVKVFVDNNGVSENHYVGITKITSDSVTINVSSDPQTATLKIGESKKFEVTSDSYYDIQVTLNSISSSKANMTVTYLHEQMPALEAGAAESTATGEEETTSGAEKANILQNIKAFVKNNWIWIVVALVAIAVIIVGISLATKKKKKEIKEKVWLKGI